MSTSPPIIRAPSRYPLPPLFLPFTARVTGVAAGEIRLSSICWARTGWSAIDDVTLPAGTWSRGLRAGDSLRFSTTARNLSGGGWAIEGPHRVTVTRAVTI